MEITSPYYQILIVYVIICTVMLLAEIGRIIYNKIIDREKAQDFKKKVAQQQMNTYPYDYSGKLFIKAKNRFQANKKFNDIVKEQKLLTNTLKKKQQKNKK